MQKDGGKGLGEHVEINIRIQHLNHICFLAES